MTSRAFGQRRWYDASFSGPLSPEELEEFLAGPWLVKVAFLKEDGWPACVPLWYQWDGEAFWLVGRKRSAWVHDLAREPRCGICIEERELPPAGGNRKVLAQCRAEVVEGPAAAEGSRWLPIAEAMALRYAGPEGPKGLAASHGWERYLVRLAPRDGHLTSWQGVDWAPRYFDPGQRPDLEADRRA